MNTGLSFSFGLPTKIVYGIDSLNRVGSEAKRLGASKTLIVTDQGVANVGLVDVLKESLDKDGLPYEVFSEVSIDPNRRVVKEGLSRLRSAKCDLVTVIGGGSPICAGKAIALLATNGGDLTDYEGVDKVLVSPLPVIAVPTTAGSGSEVSPTFIITDEDRNGHKIAVTSMMCSPVVAALDPSVVAKLPAGQFVISGMDALVHGMESICTNLSNPLTDSIAYEAIRLIMTSLPKAAFSDDMNAKAHQLLASTMANIACGNAKLGIVHGMTSAMGKYHLPHGLVNGILLPYAMEYNLGVAYEKYARVAEVVHAARLNMTTMGKARLAIAQVRELFDLLEFPDRLPADVVPKSEIPAMASMAMGRSQMKFNLRKPQESEIAQLLNRAFDGWRTE